RHAATAIIGVNANQVDITHRRVRADEAEEEADEEPVDLHNPREAPELVEEHRVGERAGRASPPAIDDLYDLIVVGLRQGSSLHSHAVLRVRAPSGVPRGRQWWGDRSSLR